MKYKKKILATLVAAVLSSAALADNVLIIGGEGDSHISVKTELEAVGHTVTYQNTTSGPTDLTGYQQVWDMRYSTALSANDMAVYDTFLKNSGYLYLSGEHGGFAVRNNSISQFTSSLGGGTISVNGFADNAQTGNTTYFIGNETVDFAAAAIITAQGGRVLSKDANNNATAMMWVGNAGDLGQDYNGTVVVVADINWTQSAFYDANNEDFLERLIGGIVAGTVAGTISDQGNGAAGGGNGTPPAPTTFSVTNTGETVVSDTMAAGTFTGNGGVLQAVTGATSITNDISLNSTGMTFDSNGQAISLTGSISGVGGLTLTNGTISLDGTYTYTGSTTVNSGTTVINNSDISSSSQVTNLGTFTNNGTTGNWVNGFDGAGNTATLTNNGTMGNGTNYSTFANNGTTGSVTNRGTFNNNAAGTTGNVVNAGTFNNYGDTGTVNNMGVFTNQAGGVVTELVYNNHVVRNYGTINSITYQGGSFTNYAGGTVGSINTTQAHGSFNNQGTITGNVTTNSNNFTNQSTGVVQGTYTNSGTLRNYGTLGVVNNSGTLTTYANSTTGNVTNTGTLTNAGTVGNVTNTGTFTNSGNTGTVSNTGTFNYNGGTLSGYTQTTGTTVISADTPLVVSGDANLDGTLLINNTPTAYGRYTLLSAGSVTGTYGVVGPIGATDYLKYSDTDLKLYVTPSAAATQSSIDALAKDLSNAINLQSSTVTGALGNDCAVFGEDGSCVSFNVGMSKAASGDLYNGGVTVAKRVNDNWRVGVTTNAPFNNPTIGNVSQTSDPAFGLFATWSKEQLSVQGSAAFNQGTLTTTRQGPETGVGKMAVDNKAFQVKASYAIPATETVTVTPYAGVRYVESNYGGYTEQGPVFPLTVNSTTRNSTSLIAGVNVAKQLTDKLSGNVSVGAVQNLSGQSATFTGTSEIGGLSTFSGNLPSNGDTNPSVGLGLNYSIDKTTKVGVNAGWQAKGSNADISSIGVTLTKGF